jgi:hypothetical protein
MVFRAQRDISAGEELTVQYCPISNGESAAERQKVLEPYGFQCTCESCLHPEMSDPIRKRYYFKMLPLTMSDLERWLTHRSLSDDYLLRERLETVRMMEEEGMYFALGPHYKAVCLLYACLGDEENTMKWGIKEARSLMSNTADGDDTRLKKAEKIKTYKKRPEWRLRKLPTTDPKLMIPGIMIILSQIFVGLGDGQSTFFTVF